MADDRRKIWVDCDFSQYPQMWVAGEAWAEVRGAPHNHRTNRMDFNWMGFMVWLVGG
jgi:hypothetical protein